MSTKTLIVLEDSSKARFGGGQRVTLAVLDATRKRYNVVLFDCAQNSEFLDRARELVTEVFSMRCSGRIVGAGSASFSVGLKEAVRSPLDLAQSARLVLSYLRERSCLREDTLIYCATKKVLLVGFVLWLLFGFRYIFHAHSLDSRFSPWFWILWLPTRFAKRIVCVSKSVRANIRMPNCRVLYNPGPETPGAERERLRLPLQVAAFASLLKWKGVVYFLQSHRYLSHLNDVDFHVYGDGPEFQRLSRYTGTRVWLHGFASNVHQIMSGQVDLVIVPSISSEACPMTPIEAMSHGIPVITTNIGGQAEIVEDGKSGIHVEPRNPRAIARAIDWFIEHPQEYSRMSSAAVLRSRTFDLDSFCGAFLGILANAFGRSD